MRSNWWRRRRRWVRAGCRVRLEALNELSVSSPMYLGEVTSSKRPVVTTRHDLIRIVDRPIRSGHRSSRRVWFLASSPARKAFGRGGCGPRFVHRRIELLDVDTKDAVGYEKSRSSSAEKARDSDRSLIV